MLAQLPRMQFSKPRENAFANFKGAVPRLPDEIDSRAAEPIELAAGIVSAFVSNKSVPVTGLPALIASVHSSLANVVGRIAQQVEEKAPAVNPRKSVFPG